MLAAPSWIMSVDTKAKPTVRRASVAEEQRVISVLTLAFSADPGMRWIYPDASRFLEHFPAFARAFGGNAFAQGTAHRVEQDAGAALWLPPGVRPDREAIEQLVQRSVAERTVAEMRKLLEKIEPYHPREPYWYLPLIGVDPMHQREGHGSALIQYALRQVDQESRPAYLETPLRNVPLYERHGFEALGKVQIGSSPTTVPMVRRPR
jgi:GNAT superfamily N-acetyltransferase